MASPYVYERQSEYWTSRQIDDALHDAGYAVEVLPIPMHHELSVPADFVFEAPNLKLFGLQYKALYHNGQDHWHIAERQHRTMARFPWIYYCLSDLRSRTQSRRALHLARFVDREGVSVPYVTHADISGRYSRWGVFLSRLEDCRIGEGPFQSADEALAAAAGVAENVAELGIIVDIFLTGVPASPGVVNGQVIKWSRLNDSSAWIEDPE